MKGDEERALTCCWVGDVDKGLLVLDHSAERDGHMSGEHMPPQTFSAWWSGLHAHALNHVQVTYKCCVTRHMSAHGHHCDMNCKRSLDDNIEWSQ
jgi:hypothetical protein